MELRIYLYKITFEEVPYYYYGVHKERKYDEEYWGSPVTNKWCWELYTPKKQILEVFSFTDENWVEAQKIENRLIKPFYQTDKWCLNEHCGSKISLKSMSKGGKTQSKINIELGIGFYGMSEEEKINASRKGGIAQGKKSKELNLGIFSPEYISSGKRKYNCSKGGKTGSYLNKQNNVGIFSMGSKELSFAGKKGGKKTQELGVGIFGISSDQRKEINNKTNSQKWECCETGYVSNAGGLTRYQMKRCIDTSLRKRIF
jgi:hypothetical protein